MYTLVFDYCMRLEAVHIILLYDVRSRTLHCSHDSQVAVNSVSKSLNDRVAGVRNKSKKGKPQLGLQSQQQSTTATMQLPSTQTDIGTIKEVLMLQHHKCLSSLLHECLLIDTC